MKLLKFFLSIVLLATLFAFPCLASESSAKEHMISSDLEQAFQKLIALSDNAVTSKNEWLNNISLEEDFMPHQKIKLSEDLIKLFELKKTVHEIKSEITTTQKMNYRISTKLLSTKKQGDYIFYDIAKEVQFNYCDLPDVLSKDGRIVQFVVRENKADNYLEIVDFFVMDDYDIRHCKEEFSLYQAYTDSIADSKDLAFKEYSLLKEVNWEENLNHIKDMMKKAKEMNSEQEIEQTIEKSPLAIAPLYKGGIKEYARRNCSKNQPPSGWGDSTVPYYDFSLIPGNYDCTNFVSHAILAGRANIYYNSNPSTGWYYKALNNRSYSWSGVPNLRNFLISNAPVGPFGSEINYTTYSNINLIPYEFGDVIQFYEGEGYNNWRHSGIVTQFYKIPSSGKYGALYCARVARGIFEYDKKAESKYEGQPKRIIKLNGTR